jgi:hypothetical protein
MRVEDSAWEAEEGTMTIDLSEYENWTAEMIALDIIWIMEVIG